MIGYLGDVRSNIKSTLVVLRRSHEIMKLRLSVVLSKMGGVGHWANSIHSLVSGSFHFDRHASTRRRRYLEGSRTVRRMSLEWSLCSQPPFLAFVLFVWVG